MRGLISTLGYGDDLNFEGENKMVVITINFDKEREKCWLKS